MMEIIIKDLSQILFVFSKLKKKKRNSTSHGIIGKTFLVAPDHARFNHVGKTECTLEPTFTVHNFLSQNEHSSPSPLGKKQKVLSPRKGLV